MKNSNNYLNSSIDDIIFEDRNQAYGAYQLRKDSSRFLKIALFIGLVLVSVISAFSLTHKSPELISKEKIIDITTVNIPDVDVNLPKPEPIIPEPPEVTQIQTASIAYTEMVARNDRDVLNADVTAIADIKDLQISTVSTNDSIIGGDIPILKNSIGSNPIPKEEYILYPSQMPEFVGGNIAMMKWLGNNINYPKQALNVGVEGTVYVSFIINTDGSISDATIVRGIGFGCDEEAIRAISAMPKWVPGKQNANAVRVKTTIPIKFQIDK